MSGAPNPPLLISSFLKSEITSIDNLSEIYSGLPACKLDFVLCDIVCPEKAIAFISFLVKSDSSIILDTK
ncbi:MAG: hypothetical protein CM15mP22_6330 [Gammaproteobacteria bacterium]|nr:MAG: hypothetical protein CM15mP22_6330 [Gammaproteobacteria bacterium]